MARERIQISVEERGSRTVRRNLSQVGSTAERAQKGVGILKSALLSLGVGLGIGAVVNTLASFSQELSTLRGITGATTEEFKSLREETKRLGSSTRFSATQAAEGATFLARAGFETNDILNSLNSTLNLAQAGSLGLGEAADIASNVLQGFRLEATESQRAVDVLAKAANSSNTNVSQLGEAMKFVAPVAAGLGVSIEEATAAVGTLSDAGLQASMAGTGLRRVLSELEGPSSKTRDILNELGLEAEDVRVSQVGLTAAIRELQKAGVDTATALEIFGQRGGPAFEVLSAGADNIEDLNGKLSDSEGFAKELARIMDDNLNGALLAVKSALEAVVISFGDLGSEAALTQLFDSLAAGLRFIASELDNILDAGKVVAAGLAVAFRGTIINALKGATAAARAFTLALLANPFTAIATALTSVIALLVAFQDKLQLSVGTTTTLGDFFTALLNKISAGFTVLVDFFNESVLPAIGGLGLEVNTAGASFENFFRFIADSVDNFIGIFVGAKDAISATFDNIPGTLADVFLRAFNIVLASFESFVNDILAGYNRIVGFFGGEGVGLIEEGSFGRIENNFRSNGERVANAFKDGFNGVSIADDFLTGVINEANSIAAERERTNAQGGSGGAVGGSASPEDQLNEAMKNSGASSSTTSDTKDTGPTFDEILADLDQQRRLLKLNNDERQIQNELLRIEDQLEGNLSETQKDTLRNRLEQLQSLERESRLLDEIKGPQEEIQKNQKALNRLYESGRITLDQYNQKLLELKKNALSTSKTFEGGLKRGLISIKEEFTDVASVTEDAVTNAFKGAEDALVEFVSTGKLEVSGLVDSILEDLSRIAVRKGITAPLADAIGLGGETKSDSGGGGGGFFGSLFGGSGGGGDFFGDLFSGFSDLLPGFASGGSFNVGPQTSVGTLSGTDNRLVAFRARDNEQVTVNKPGESSGPAPMIQNITINTPDAESFKRSEAQLSAQAARQLQASKRA